MDLRRNHTPMAATPVPLNKRALRREALARRGEAHAAAPDPAHRLAGHAAAIRAAFRAAHGGEPGAVAAYVPMRDEIDPLPLAAAIGARLALPKVSGPTMTFHADDGPRTPGAFGTVEPAGEALLPHLLLVPLLAFTADGHRLGYGGGYYDRWLAAHPHALAVGVAYAAQQLPDLPVEPHDVPLAAIATETDLVVPVAARGARCGF